MSKRALLDALYERRTEINQELDDFEAKFPMPNEGEECRKALMTTTKTALMNERANISHYINLAIGEA